MKTRLNKTLQIILLASGIIVLSIFTSCNQDNKTQDHEPMKMEKEQSDSKIVREGMIDLMMIDENKDGMVYQDPMDWNVISDEPGKCPLCKMELKEVTVKEAKENLIKNDFKVKDN
jgi:c-di-AMP phosphodiesterase-like protein